MTISVNGFPFVKDRNLEYLRMDNPVYYPNFSAENKHICTVLWRQNNPPAVENLKNQGVSVNQSINQPNDRSINQSIESTIQGTTASKNVTFFVVSNVLQKQPVRRSMAWVMFHPRKMTWIIQQKSEMRFL